jgi:hypothetical protein
LFLLWEKLVCFNYLMMVISAAPLPGAPLIPSARPRDSSQLRLTTAQSRSPLYAFVHLGTEEAFQRAKREDMRLFGLG